MRSSSTRRNAKRARERRVLTTDEAVVDHDDRVLSLRLAPQARHDLVEYLKSL